MSLKGESGNSGSPFPFPDDSPLGRACNNPVAALALLAEAVARSEKNIEPYLIAANAAIGHVAKHGLVLLPEGEPGEVADVLSKPGEPSPHELYDRTGGGEAYRRAMIKHGYVIVAGDMRCGDPSPTTSCTCLLKKGHDGAHLCPHGEWTS